MGWNDRLPEDPYWPTYYDADAYAEWHKYLEACRLEDIKAMEQQVGLSSQNLDPASISLTSVEKDHGEQHNREEIKSYNASRPETEEEESLQVGNSSNHDDRPF